MGRLVRKPNKPELDQHIDDLDGVLRSGPARIQVAVAGDNYLERMAKYVPAEAIGFSMLINAILDQAVKSGGADATMAGFPVNTIAIGALVLTGLMTPLFCWYVREDGDAWMVNAVVSTIAFPFWAYLMGAVAFDKFHDGNLAAILILAFSAVSGLVAPVADKPAAAEQKSANPKEGPRLVEGLKA